MGYKLIKSTTLIKFRINPITITITLIQDEEMKQEQPEAAEAPVVDAPAEARRHFLIDFFLTLENILTNVNIKPPC
jgi:hypothetical protein